jgi:CO dehydrogenase nickel-insertion accessory protein CooC1
VGARYLLVNRGVEPLDPALITAAEATGVPLLGVVPGDDGVTRADLTGGGLFDLERDSAALAAVRTLLAEAIPALNADVVTPL